MREVTRWFKERQGAHRFVAHQIPFSSLRRWSFDEVTGNLSHDSGCFFSIEGVEVETNYGFREQWCQPMIVQPEVGILGILAKEFDGVLHFLMQVKMEPGNINMVQLSPTLQATYSNYTRVHEGRVPPYLDYFLQPSGHTTIVDSLQSEQGGRFYRKRNRNMVLEITEDIDVLPDFHWLTLAQIQQLLYEENIVNMDTRTVIGCLPLHKTSGELPQGLSSFGARLLRSLSTTTSASSNEQVMVWLDCQRDHYHLSTRTIPLNEVDEWHKGEMAMTHSRGDYFSIIACEVEAASREVGNWSQPLVRACAPGLAALIVKDIDGILHALVQAKVEPGLMNTLEIAPSVQCTTGDYRRGPVGHQAPFLDYVLKAKQSQTRFDSHLSEEGGRFFREANRNMILEAAASFPEELPRNYIWATLRQLKQLVESSNMLNVECRCLLSCLALLDRGKEEPWLSSE